VFESSGEVLAREKDAFREEALTAKQQLAQLRDLLQSLRSQETDVSRFYDREVVPAANTLNSLTKASLTFNDLDNLLDGVLSVVGKTGAHAETIKALRDFKRDHMDPFFDGLNTMLQSGVDVWSTGAGFLDAITRYLGPDDELSKYIKEAQTNLRHVEEALTEAAEMLAIINETLDLLQGFLMAACKLLAALKQFAYNLAWIMNSIGDLLPSLLLNLIPGNPTWFRIPRPLSLLLTQVDGLMSRLAGFDEVGKCFNQVFDRNNPSGQLNLPGRQASTNALTDGLASFVAGMNQAVSATLASAVANMLGVTVDLGVPNPFDAIRAKYQANLQPTKLPPPRPVVLPEQGALMGFLASAQMLLGFIPELLQGGLFKPGATFIEPEQLYALSDDGSKTALTPHPAYTIGNMIQANRLGWFQVVMLQVWIQTLQQIADAIRSGYFSDEERKQREALAAMAEGKGKSSALVNIGLGSGLGVRSRILNDKLNCRRDKNESRGNGGSDDPALNPPTQEQLEKDFLNTFSGGTGAAGLPNSVATVGGANNPWGTADGSVLVPGTDGKIPVVTVDQVFDGLPGSVLPLDLTGEHRQLLAGYAVINGLDDFESLPILLLLKDQTGRSQFDRLKYLSALLEAQRLEPLMKRAHASLLTKTNNQGLRVDSPYTWLAEGLSLIGEYSLLTWVEKFLLHDDTFDMRPIAAWWEQAQQIDFSTPIASGLTTDEYNAAQISYTYLNLYAADALTNSELVLWLRIRADDTGGLAGYEFYLMTAVLTLIKRASAEILADGDFVTVGKAAKVLADRLTHQELVDGLLDGLYED
jgi:hypothetical protein